MARACIDFPAVDGVAVCFSEEPGTRLIERIEFVIAGWNDDKCAACRQDGDMEARFDVRNRGVIEHVRAFLHGHQGLDRAALLDRCVPVPGAASSFGARARQALLSLQPGETITYGRLAELAGNPRAARAAGTVMRGNPLPVIIPCHKVVAASGPGGFAGNRHPALATVKKRLLDLDGCVLP